MVGDGQSRSSVYSLVTLPTWRTPRQGLYSDAYFLQKKRKEKEIYIVPRLSFGNVSDLLFLPDFEGLRRPDPSSC